MSQAGQRDVAVLVGSLRKGSYTRQIAKELVRLAPPALALDIVEIGELPLYNADLETATPPPSWVTFRNRLCAADAVLFATTEYNRSVPAALKNAIDVGSRPKEDNVWNDKPGAIVSVAPGSLAAFGANHHLRQSLVFVNVLILQQPEAYVGNVKSLLDEQGKLVKPDTEAFLRGFLDAFAKWIERVGG